MIRGRRGSGEIFDPASELFCLIRKTERSFVRAASLCIVLFATFLASHASAEELRFYGYIPTDAATLKSFSMVRRYRSFLPEKVDLSSRFPTPGQQGNLGACVPWAVGYAARSYYAHTFEGRKRNSKKDIPSPSFIYNVIRDPDDCKAGSKFLDAFELLRKGSLSLAEYPYRAICTKPDKKLQDKAEDFKIQDYTAVDHEVIDDVKGQLAQGNPVVFGIMVNPRFEKLRGARVYKSATDDKTPFAHAMTAVGYDERKQAIKVINSWGTGWGDRGFGWISYDTFARHADEAYIIRVDENLSPPEPELVAELPIPVPKPIVKPPVPETIETEPVTAKPPVPPLKPKPVPLIVAPPPKPTVLEPIETKPVLPSVVELVPPTPNPPVNVAPIDQPTLKPELVVKPAPPTVPEISPAGDCSSVITRAVGATTVISGFVGTEIELAKIRQAHPEPKFQVDVELRPWPQCEVLMTLGKALKQQDAPKLDTRNGQTVFEKADYMVFEIAAPKKPAYVYITYVQADGSVVHLHQPDDLAVAPLLSSKIYSFGDGIEGRSTFKASAPFGREMVLVLASASPLFERKLPAHQTEREYLTALRKAMIYKVDPSMPDREISAAFLGIETKGK